MPLPSSLSSSRPACTPCDASARARWWMAHRGGPARGVRTARGARPRGHAWVPDPPDHPGHDPPRRDNRPGGQPRCAVPPALVGRHLPGSAQHASAEGCPARPHGARRVAGMHGLGPRRSPGPSGEVPIRHPAPSRRGAAQLSGCAAGARHAQSWHATNSVDGAPRTPPSGGAAGQEATPPELPVDAQPSAGPAAAVDTACAHRFTEGHSTLTHLLVASCFEIVFALSLKYTEGFSRLGSSLMTVAAGAASFLIQSQALKTLPTGTCYAIWTGIGAFGTVILGMLLFHEPRDMARLVCMRLIFSGLITDG